MTLRTLPALLLLVGATMALGASCHRDPPTAATSSDDALCGHLAQLGCSVGRDPSCPIALARLRTLEVVPDTCALKATSMAGVQACGFECAP